MCEEWSELFVLNVNAVRFVSVSLQVSEVDIANTILIVAANLRLKIRLAFRLHLWMVGLDALCSLFVDSSWFLDLSC